MTAHAFHGFTRNDTVYAKSARFDGAHALTEEELFKLAPSIFATEAHESRSERFVPIPTIEVVRGLQREGFSVVGAKQALTRVEGKAPFTKHALRLRKLDDDARYSVGDTVFEMMLKNANDGTCAYDLMAAMWRIRCLNSLVVKTGEIDSVKVRHNGRNVVNEVIEGTYRVVGEAERVLAAPQDWGRLQLNRDEQKALANAAHVLRFADGEGNVKTPIKPEQLLEARRASDRQNDLWTVWNTVQEHVIKGGDHGIGRDANNKVRRTTTRAVKGIDQDIKLNVALFMLGEEMARLKSAA